MGHPSSYYLKFLLLENWGDEDFDSISLNQTLTSYGLPGIGDDEFSYLRLSMAPPDDFTFSNRKHKSSVDFMKDEGLYTLWNPSKDDRRVLTFLLHQQRVRGKVDIMLMGEVPAIHIANHLNQEFRFRDPLTKEMISTYHHFFWNTELPSLKEWEFMLDPHPQKDALLAAYHCGPDQAMYRVGGNPRIKDPKKPLREANRQAYWVLQSLRFKPDTSENIKLRSQIARDLLTLHDAIHGAGADTDDQLKKFRQFLVERVPSAVEAWDSIVGPEGSYSGDGKERDADDDGDA